MFALALAKSMATNGRYVLDGGLSWKERAFLSFLLQRTKDKRRLKRYFSGKQSRRVLGHFARNLFLLSLRTKCSLDVLDDDLLIGLNDRGENYRFLLAAVPRPDVPFFHGMTPFVDIFVRRIYDPFDYKGGTVIDVGGYVGDTAVYFALNGAREVYSFEPNPVSFRYMLRNLELNGVSDRVRASNSAVSRDRTKYVVPDKAGAGSLHTTRRGSASYDVETVDPEGLLKDMPNIALLKVDCKGCEMELFQYGLSDVAMKAKHIIVDSGRLDPEQRSRVVSNLKSAGFLFREGPPTVLYFQKA